MVSRDVSRRKSASGPSASEMSWTDEETEYHCDIMISLWNGEDVLFNCRNKDYFKKVARHSAINRILSCLGKEGENI